MNLPRPHPGRLTVAVALPLALAVGLVAWAHGPSTAPDAGTSPAPAALAAAPPADVPAPVTSSPDPASPTPTAVQPKTLGDDPVLDDLWHRCEQGSGAACDQLFDQAPLNSDYETFGLTCGNRPDVLHCTLEMDTPLTTAPLPSLPAPASVPSTIPTAPTAPTTSAPPALPPTAPPPTAAG